MFWLKLRTVWTDPSLRRRVLIIAVAVGLSVTLAHVQLDGWMPASAWLAFHASLPLAVFTGGAMAAGVRRLNRTLVVRGVVTTLVVTTAFTLINNRFAFDVWISLLLNCLVPATVSSLGAMSGVDPRPRPAMQESPPDPVI